MGYFIDLIALSINDYKDQLLENDLLPSRMILKKDLDNNFRKLIKSGIYNVGQLQERLKNKTRLIQIMEETGIDQEYLKILLREINSIQPKPNKLREFHDLPTDDIQKLEDIGINTTEKLFEYIRTPEEREKLSNKTGIPQDIIMKLTRLTDVSRIRWVGTTFAYVLVKAGFDSAKKVADANYHELYAAIKDLNIREQIFKGNIGENDIRLTVIAAKQISHEIVY